MRFIIVQPAIMNPEPPWNYVTDRYAILQQRIAEALDSTVYFDDDPPMAEADIVLTYNAHFQPVLGERILALPESTVLLVHWNDLHAIGLRKRPQMQRLMDRAAVIFAPYKFAFRKMWPEYLHKFVWLPHYIAPTERYSDMPFNESPIPKCLVTGTAQHEYYPFRRFIVDNMNDDTERLQHPGYRTGRRLDAKVGDAYAQELNKYVCSVATCSSLDYSLGKYMEITASGALCLGQYTPDLDDLGFVNGVNYIRVDETNVYDVIHDVVRHPEEYGKIRRQGREFALKEFAVEKRIDVVTRLVRRITDELQ